MIQNFIRFLTEQHTLGSAKSNNVVFDAELERWANLLNNYLISMKAEFPARFIQNIVAIVDKSGDKPVIRNDNLLSIFQKTFPADASFDERIKCIDQRYKTLVSHLNVTYLRHRFQTFYPLPKGTYPFKRNHSGVGFIFRVMDADGKEVRGSSIETQSSVGMKKSDRSALIESCRKNIGRNAILNDALVAMGMPRQDQLVDLKSPHAEDLFFANNLDDAIEILKEIDASKVDAPSDELWLTHLTYPRIEFLQTSSICEKCQPYFKALRHILNANGLHLPMVMFAGSPYHTDEPPHPLAYIDMSGEYKCPNISWEETNGTKKFEIQDQQALQDYAYFELRGRAILPTLLKSDLLRLTFWKKLISCTGSPVYFLWLAEYSTKLLSDLNEGIGAISITQKDFPGVDVNLPRLVESEKFEKYYRENVKDILEENKAFWDFIWGIAYTNTDQPLTESEHLYWSLFLRVVKYGKIIEELGDGTSYTLTEEDFVSMESFLLGHLKRRGIDLSSEGSTEIPSQRKAQAVVMSESSSIFSSSSNPSATSQLSDTVGITEEKVERQIDEVANRDIDNSMQKPTARRTRRQQREHLAKIKENQPSDRDSQALFSDETDNNDSQSGMSPR